MHRHSIPKTILTLLATVLLKPSNVSTHSSAHHNETEYPFYDGTNVEEFLAICEFNGTEDYEHPECIANQLVNPEKFESHENNETKERRRNQLKLAILKVGGFKNRLEHLTEFVLQIVAFLLPLVVGLYLYFVGHFTRASLTAKYSNAPTFGMPCWQYLRMGYAAVKVDPPGSKKKKGVIAVKPAPPRKQAAKSTTVQFKDEDKPEDSSLVEDTNNRSVNARGDDVITLL